MVSLVEEKKVDTFLVCMRDYYTPLIQAGTVSEGEDLDGCLFASKPSAGAAVLRLELQ